MKKNCTTVNHTCEPTEFGARHLAQVCFECRYDDVSWFSVTKSSSRALNDHLYIHQGYIIIGNLVHSSRFLHIMFYNLDVRK